MNYRLCNTSPWQVPTINYWITFLKHHSVFLISYMPLFIHVSEKHRIASHRHISMYNSRPVLSQYCEVSWKRDTHVCVYCYAPLTQILVDTHMLKNLCISHLITNRPSIKFRIWRHDWQCHFHFPLSNWWNPVTLYICRYLGDMYSS